MVTRAWKVYGADGHRQKAAFGESIDWDFSENGKTRKIEIICEDRIGTAEYAIAVITCDTEEECKAEMWGQITDGVFENCTVGKVEPAHWYAIHEDENDNDDGTGSFILGEAIKMARERGYKFVAEIDITDDFTFNQWAVNLESEV